jgi:hypothetical protein
MVISFITQAPDLHFGDKQWQALALNQLTNVIKSLKILTFLLISVVVFFPQYLINKNQ